MPSREEVPEEAICKLAATPLPQGVRVLLDAARTLLTESAPVIRNQERQRIQEALPSDAGLTAIVHAMCQPMFSGDFVSRKRRLKENLPAVLDTLEADHG